LGLLRANPRCSNAGAEPGSEPGKPDAHNQRLRVSAYLDRFRRVRAMH
jgi:hypothetical protein